MKMVMLTFYHNENKYIYYLYLLENIMRDVFENFVIIETIGIVNFLIKVIQYAVTGNRFNFIYRIGTKKNLSFLRHKKKLG